MVPLERECRLYRVALDRVVGVHWISVLRHRGEGEEEGMNGT